MKDYSQFGEQATLLMLTSSIPPGTYLDIGAHDGIECSNTRYLWESGWNGILVEPTTKRYNQLAINYPERIISFQNAVSDFNGPADFYDIVNHIDGRSSLSAIGFPSEKITVMVVKWDDLLEMIKQKGIDPAEIQVLSIDTEGQDILIINQIDFTTFCPKVVIVETAGNYEDFQHIMIAAGYELIKQTTANLIYKKV